MFGACQTAGDFWCFFVGVGLCGLEFRFVLFGGGARAISPRINEDLPGDNSGSVFVFVLCLSLVGCQQGIGFLLTFGLPLQPFDTNDLYRKSHYPVLRKKLDRFGVKVFQAVRSSGVKSSFGILRRGCKPGGCDKIAAAIQGRFSYRVRRRPIELQRGRIARRVRGWFRFCRRVCLLLPDKSVF